MKPFRFSPLEIGIAGTLVLTKLWLVRGQALLGIGDSPGDDRLYLELASYLVSGRWLGSYNHLTLAKGPFYSMWVAATFVADVPLLLAEHILYAVACAAFVVALSPGLRSRRWAWALFAVLWLNPVSFADQSMTRAAREGIYPALTLLVLAGAAGVALRLDRSSGALRWAALLGSSFAALWLCREEGVWIIPPAAVALSTAIHRPFPWSRAKRALVIAAGLAGAMVGTVLLLNWWRYGEAVVSEQTGGAFPKAYGALARVRHARWRRYVLLPREARQRIYAVSPSFAELRPFIEGNAQGGWMAPGCQYVGVCDDVGGGWLLWDIRDAAAQAGHCSSGAAAAAFWSAVTREVNGACADERLDCLPPRATLMPPWRSEYVKPYFEAVAHGASYLAHFEGITAQPTPSVGTQEKLAIFHDLTHERLAVGRHEVQVVGWAFLDGGGAVGLRLASSGTLEPTTVEHNDRPDVKQFLTRKGVRGIIPNETGFSVRGSCESPCELIASAGTREIARLPLDGMGRMIEKPPLEIAIDTVAESGSFSAQRRLDQLRIRVLNRIRDIYQGLTPALTIAALIVWLVSGVLAVRRRELPAHWLLGLAVLTGVATRLGLLGLIEVAAFSGVNVLYLSAAYPLLLGFMVLGLRSGLPPGEASS